MGLAEVDRMGEVVEEEGREIQSILHLNHLILLEVKIRMLK